MHQGSNRTALVIALATGLLLAPGLRAANYRPFPQAGSAPGYGLRPNHLSQAQANAAVSTGNALWTKVERAGYAILDRLQTNYAAATGLAPDFSVVSGGNWAPASPNFLESANDDNE